VQYIDDNDNSVGSRRHSVTLVRRQPRLCSSAGFTLVELVVIIALIGVLLSIAAPQFAANLEQGRKAKCLSNRHNIEQDERGYALSNNAASLVIDSRYQCASGGTYVWLVSDLTSPDYPRVGCSLHYGEISAPPTPAALTSLGSTFSEITTAMIDLINNYYQQNHHDYPHDSGSAAFTDLGLNRADWSQPVNGLLYTPAGDKVLVTLASGYTMTVKDSSGRVLTLTPISDWNLAYYVNKGAWYNSKNDKKVDITTLQVTQN
jgi:type II secretory pathway pseudopilin PulG